MVDKNGRSIRKNVLFLWDNIRILSKPTTMATILYYILLLIFTIVSFIPFSLLFFATVAFDKERVALHFASRLWSYGIFRLCPFWHIRVEGKEKIDRSRPWIIITNHQSMLDIPLMYVLPTTFKWVSKKEVQKMPIFGWVLRMHGDIPIERGSRDSAKQMIERCSERIARGTSVIIFPEGTRTKTGEIGRFKDGAFFAAQHAGTGIQPVVIDGTWSLMNGWKLRMPHTFRVRILEPLPADYVASKQARELATELESRMRNELAAMRNETKKTK